MDIVTIGSPTKVKKKLCKEAIVFFGDILLSKALNSKVCLTLNFQKFKKKSEFSAFCDWEYDNNRPRDFIITVNKNLNKKRMLIAIAHEMVHVKQFAKGELKDYVKSSKSKWCGKIYDNNKLDYWDQPWEIDAYGREKGLYYKFLIHKDSK